MDGVVCPLSCPNGQVPDSTGVSCVACGANEITVDGVQECSACQDGYGPNNDFTECVVKSMYPYHLT